MSDVPRIARSVDDLRVGMVVVSQALDCGTWEGPWTLGRNFPVPSSRGWFDKHTVVILSDPPARDWLVPATQMEALREAVDVAVDGDVNISVAVAQQFGTLAATARAVLDAAREVEHE